MKNDSHQIYKDPAAFVQNLIRFDTTNPPGNEAECVAYIKNLLDSAGIESLILAKDPARPNLVARVKGTGNAPLILLYGHVDVVTTAHQEWAHPPFEGKVVDGFIWVEGQVDTAPGHYVEGRWPGWPISCLNWMKIDCQFMLRRLRR